MDNCNCDLLESVVKKAKACGADHVDIMFSKSSTVSATTRLTRLEKLVEADVVEASMRVAVGNRYATVSCDSIQQLQDSDFMDKAIFAAKNAPEENLKIRPDSTELCKNFRAIDICDRQFEVDTEQMISDARKCEEIALQTDGITNSEGAETGYARTSFTLLRDDGFCASYEKTCNNIAVVTLAEKNGNLERDYAYSSTIYNSDLKTAEEIAKESAEKTLKRLGAQKVKSCKVPVVYNRETARQLLSKIIEAVNGATVARGISFLKDKLGQKIFSENIIINDRYAIDRGLKSRPFDAEGLECRDNNVVSNGVLNSFILNTKYANKLKMRNTANAGGWEGIVANNICIENGKKSFDELIGGIKSGLYVTEVLGNGLNITNGNYSQGAVGFWIENGEITYPVNEITVAGNFTEMFSHCDVASDLKIETGCDSPTIFFEEMVVGGI